VRKGNLKQKKNFDTPKKYVRALRRLGFHLWVSAAALNCTGFRELDGRPCGSMKMTFPEHAKKGALTLSRSLALTMKTKKALVSYWKAGYWKAYRQSKKMPVRKESDATKEMTCAGNDELKKWLLERES
jgi:hypothetical protein